jgi:hypothetical protein
VSAADRVLTLRELNRATLDRQMLLDLPGAPLPPEDAPAPPRFVPDYDNLVLSRRQGRVISEEHRKKVFLSAARVRATFLIDGFVRGAWKVEKTRRAATLVIEPFEHLSRGIAPSSAKRASISSAF